MGQYQGLDGQVRRKDLSPNNPLAVHLRGFFQFSCFGKIKRRRRKNNLVISFARLRLFFTQRLLVSWCQLCLWWLIGCYLFFTSLSILLLLQISSLFVIYASCYCFHGSTRGQEIDSREGSNVLGFQQNRRYKQTLLSLDRNSVSALPPCPCTLVIGMGRSPMVSLLLPSRLLF